MAIDAAGYSFLTLARVGSTPGLAVIGCLICGQNDLIRKPGILLRIVTRRVKIVFWIPGHRRVDPDGRQSTMSREADSFAQTAIHERPVTRNDALRLANFVPMLLKWVAFGVGALWFGIEARAQSTSNSRSTTSTATSASNAQLMPVPILPMMIAGNGGGMFGGGNSGLSPTDAAALGPGAGLPQSNNIFNNPMAAPFLYSSMFPMQQNATTSSSGLMNGMSTNQLGLLMLANQGQMLGGIGSGQLSGACPGPGGLSRSKNAKGANPRVRRNPSQPLGVAGHYFNRTTPDAKVVRTQVHYNRQNQYFPQSPR